MKASLWCLAFASMLAVPFPTACLGETVVSGGVTYRSIPEIRDRLGMELHTADDDRTAVLSSAWSTVELTRGSRVMQVNQIKLYLGYPTLEHSDQLYLPELDWQFTLSSILIPPRLSIHQQQIRTIVIDPGHGGKDPGAQNLALQLDEKDLTLKVAKRLAYHLKKAGYRPVLTRKSDRYLTLEQRSAVARRAGADLFLSLHFNAATQDTANGIETYAYTLLNQPSTGRTVADASDKIFRRANRFDALNTLFAYLIQRNLIRRTQEIDRGVKRARFVVLEDLTCPGALVELGFLRHPQTAPQLQQDAYLDHLAASLSEAIVHYQQWIQRT